MIKSDDKFNRYSRQIFIEEVGVEGQRALLDAKVLVIGAGGLGSVVLPYLAAAGVGKLGIVDFDKVEWHNLNRQIIHQESSIGKCKVESAFEFVKSLNSTIEVECFNLKLTEDYIAGVLEDYDVVLDCSDNFETRYLINDTCVKLDKVLVYGSIFAFEGQVAIFNYKRSKNLRNIFLEPPDPEMAPNCDVNGALGPLPGVIGSMMAMLCVEVLVGMEVPVNELMVFDLRNWNFIKIYF